MFRWIRHLSPHLILCTLLAAVVGCDGSDQTSAEKIKASQDLTENQTLWATFAEGNYEYEIHKSCFCPPPLAYHVTVIDGVIVSSAPIDAQEAPTNVTTGSEPPSINELFDVVKNAIKGSGTIEVAYSSEYGLPENINVDPIPGAIDDEYSYRIENFQLIETDALSLMLDRRSAWEDASINAYAMELNVSCYCATPGVIDLEVIDSQVVSGYSGNLGRALNANELNSLPATIPQLFDYAEQQLRNSAYPVQITYDPIYAYPTEVNPASNPLIADGPASFSVLSLTPTIAE